MQECERERGEEERKQIRDLLLSTGSLLLLPKRRRRQGKKKTREEEDKGRRRQTKKKTREEEDKRRRRQTKKKTRETQKTRDNRHNGSHQVPSVLVTCQPSSSVSGITMSTKSGIEVDKLRGLQKKYLDLIDSNDASVSIALLIPFRIRFPSNPTGD